MNTAALKRAIEASGLKTVHIIDSVGMSRSAFYRKANGLVEFTVSEMNALIEALRLGESETRDIFFRSKVS